MTKAFDKLNHYGLYIKLMKRNVPPVLLCTLMDWYNKSTAFVRWNDAFSSCFRLICGVRQGGVLSPILFSVYVDDIISKLQASKLGCSMHNVYVGCIMYADDLILISASVTVLQQMINVCSEEVSYLDMCFNVSKSTVIRIGRHYRHVCADITLPTGILKYSSSLKYLGIYILSCMRFRIDVNKLKVKFFTALNGLLSKCRGRMDEVVKLHLINSYCKPLLLYGCDCIALNKTDSNSICRSWNTVFYKLFNVNDSQCITDILTCTGTRPILDDIASRRARFLHKVAISNNTIMKLLADLC